MMILMILMPTSAQDLNAVMPQLLVTKTVMRPLMCQLMLVTKTMRHVKNLMYQLLVMQRWATPPVMAPTSPHV